MSPQLFWANVACSPSGRTDRYTATGYTERGAGELVNKDVVDVVGSLHFRQTVAIKTCYGLKVIMLSERPNGLQTGC